MFASCPGDNKSTTVLTVLKVDKPKKNWKINAQKIKGKIMLSTASSSLIGYWLGIGPKGIM